MTSLFDPIWLGDLLLPNRVFMAPLTRAREHAGADRIGPAIKRAFGGVFVANEGFDGASAQADLDAGNSDAVAFGKLFIANPDLPRRLRERAPLNEPQPATFYSEGATGYTDYPYLQEAAA